MNPTTLTTACVFNTVCDFIHSLSSRLAEPIGTINSVPFNLNLMWFCAAQWVNMIQGQVLDSHPKIHTLIKHLLEDFRLEFLGMVTEAHATCVLHRTSDYSGCFLAGIRCRFISVCCFTPGILNCRAMLRCPGWSETDALGW